MSGAVLVTDGEQRAALALVRSLGRAGRRVEVASHEARCLAGGSRLAAGEHRVPSPLESPDAFVDAVGRIVAQSRPAWVVPATDAALLALTAKPDRVAPAGIPFPGHETIRAVGDKQLVSSVAPDCGIAVPTQQVLAGPGDRPAAGAFPCFAKPSRSVADAGGRRVQLGVRLLENQADLDQWRPELPPAAWPLLLQQRVVGPGVGLFLLRWQGRTRAVFAHRRLREKPPVGGVSVYRESIEAPPGLVEQTEALLDRFGWEGPAMVEYKLDAATGTPYLMEINGRYWGSLQLAIDAGVDFPRLHLELAEGRDPGPVPAYRTGVRCRWEFGELDYLLARLRRGNPELGLPAGAPGRLRGALEVFRPGGSSCRWEIFRSDDPGPFGRAVRAWLRGRSR